MTMHQYESVAELYEDLLSSKSLQDRKTKSASSSSSESEGDQVPLVSALEKYQIFSALAFTIIVSSGLLVGNTYQWTITDDLYSTIAQRKATFQFLIQLVANGLGAIEIGVIYLLINYSTRLRMSSSRVPLELLDFWASILAQRVDWTLPIRLLVPLLLFLTACLIPSALWAGAITPVGVLSTRHGSILVPSWDNSTLLHQNYNNRSGLPSRQTRDGDFTFAVGEALAGALLATAATATTIDGSVRRHAKQDLTGFTYLGRSYGVGASVGLTTTVPGSNSTMDPLTVQYSYLERGYHSRVTCLYNSSSAYVISPTPNPNESLAFPVHGFLPNSNGIEEWARYTSYSPDAIVAMGVASSPASARRVVSIAAGQNYAHLNNTQCEIVFQPSFFTVSVDVVARTIVALQLEKHDVRQKGWGMGIEPTGFLTFLATWQLSQLSTGQSRLYSSSLGDALSRNINNHIAAAAATSAIASASTTLSLANATLPGVRSTPHSVWASAATSSLSSCSTPLSPLPPSSKPPGPAAGTG